jgi:hypothetical protein
MKVVIEFYRIREWDNARAVIGQETSQAATRETAIKKAHALAETLNMPQQPDGMLIADGEGNEIYSYTFEKARSAGK